VQSVTAYGGAVSPGVRRAGRAHAGGGATALAFDVDLHDSDVAGGGRFRRRDGEELRTGWPAVGGAAADAGPESAVAGGGLPGRLICPKCGSHRPDVHFWPTEPRPRHASARGLARPMSGPSSRLPRTGPALLQSGEMTLEGLVSWSTNYTFVVTLGVKSWLRWHLQALGGEPPQWDFAAVTLCRVRWPATC
jgi:hypothetical protein